MNTETKMLKNRKSVGTKLAIASLILSILPALYFLYSQANILLNDQPPNGFALGPNLPPTGYEPEPDRWPSSEVITDNLATLIVIILIAILLPIILGLLGLILGILALIKKKEKAAGTGGKVMAIAGIIIGISDICYSTCYSASAGLVLWIFFNAGR